MVDSDILIFAEESEEATKREPNEPWKVLIVDDESEVHTVTKMVLDGFEFEGKALRFLSASTSGEALRLLGENPDIAVVILDVVMESNDAGLQVAKAIRSELKNSLVRIILRTGQPGQAPERRVILDFDINDYKEKTELTSQKLFTSLVAALRSYRDLVIIDSSRKGLEKIIDSSATIFELKSMSNFVTGILTQLTSILQLNSGSFYCQTSSLAATEEEGRFYVAAATGDYASYLHRRIDEVLPNTILERLSEALKNRHSIYFENSFVGYFRTKTGAENLIYFEGLDHLSALDKYLIEVFSTNVSIAFDNIYLNNELENTQREVVFTLGEVAEARSKETGNHVRRVAEYSALLARMYGLTVDECELIRLASPMHDIGKLAIPDSILSKPGRLTPEEFSVIKTHATVGRDMLKHSQRPLIQAACTIAYQHHERFDGKGYPQGLMGESIHLYGRITAVADVFDALSRDRVYKKAWPLEQILRFFQEERGLHFDPALTDILLNNIEEFVQIWDKYKEEVVL